VLSRRRRSSGESKALAIWVLSFTPLEANRNLLTATDLAIVDANPLESLRFLYAFGALGMEGGKMVRRSGVRWTIKGGVVYDNEALMEDVVTMVAESKKNWTNPIEPPFR